MAEEALVKMALRGAQDLARGRGQFARETSTGGTQTLDHIGLQTLIGQGAYAVLDGDGTDQTADIMDAVTKAATHDGAVAFGPGTYGLTDTVEIPPNVSVFGFGHVTLQALAPLAKVLSLDETDLHGNRNGIIQNITIDGADAAVCGLYVGLVVQRLFQRVTVNNCVDVGCVLDMAQNNTFVRCDFEQNGSAAFALGGGLRLNHGAGNNIFVGTQIRENVNRQLMICENDTVDDPAKAAFPLGPSGNIFYGGTIEVPKLVKTDTIRIRAGRYNRFDGVSINGTGVTAAFNLVHIDRADAATALVMFTNCNWIGTTAWTRAIRVDDVGYVVIEGGLFENHAYAFSANDSVATPSIFISPRTIIPVGSSVTAMFEQLGTATEDEVLSSGNSAVRHVLLGNSYRVSRALVGEYVFEASVDGDPVRRYRVNAQGGVEWGGGAVAMDVNLNRTVFAGGQIGMRYNKAVASDVGFILQDGVTAPAAIAGQAQIYVDTADGDLKIKYGDGTTKVIVADT